MVAMGQSNALAVMAFAPAGSLLHAPDMYMKKIVVSRRAKGAIDLRRSLSKNLLSVAKALDKPLTSLRMVTLDKPRLRPAIDEATKLGVKVFALPDGDVAASVQTCMADNAYDVMFTIGGAPEGVISACAVTALGGDMQAELIDFCEAKGDSPEHRQIAQDERRRCGEMGVEVNRVYQLDDIVSHRDVLFAATGVTGGELLRGIQHTGGGIRTQTILISGIDQTCNIVDSLHSW